MSEQIITQDKSYLYKYHAKPTMREEGFEDEAPVCKYCGNKKHFIGRFWVCPCTGKDIYLPSGKKIRK